MAMPQGWDYSGTIVFTRDTAEGALANDTRIRKVLSEPGDGHQDGALGAIIGSMGPFNLHGFPNIRYLYFIEWDDMPGMPIGMHEGKLEPA